MSACEEKYTWVGGISKPVKRWFYEFSCDDPECASPRCVGLRENLLGASAADDEQETEWETPRCHLDEWGKVQHSVNCECWGPKDGPIVKRRKAGPWIPVT